MKSSKKNILIITIIIVLLFSSIYLFTDIFKPTIYTKKKRSKNIIAERKNDDKNLFKTIGWIRVQGTNIDTPIITYTNKEANMVASKDNYVWNVIGDEKLYNKVNIIGHNLLNLSKKPDIGLKDFSRFDDLMAFIYYDFVKENKYIQYTINGHDYIYKVYAVDFEYRHNLDLSFEGNATKEMVENFIIKEKKKSLYDFNVKVNGNDKIISLITCTRFYGIGDEREFVVNARLVHKDEELTNYKVTKTKRYKKVEKVLRGDLENEKA
ncbi:MAG: class B sortase [Bacilli bacterium]|nr:class B sortase [Bacilli bacterium]